MLFVGKWLYLETTLLNEINQTHKVKCHITSLIWEIQSINNSFLKRQVIGNRDTDILQMGIECRNNGDSTGNAQNEHAVSTWPTPSD